MDYSDLVRLTDIVVEGAGGTRAWQGRLEKTPRASGNELSISPAAVGHQAELDDNKTIRVLYVDMDLSRWQGTSVSRQIILNGSTYTLGEGAVGSDPTNNLPAIVQSFTLDGTKPTVESWYDAGSGQRIGGVYYDFATANWQTADADANWHADAGVSDDDLLSNHWDTGNLVQSVTSGSGYFEPASPQRWALLEAFYSAVATASPATERLFNWRNVTVYGDHDLPRRGPDPGGLFDTDIIGHAIGRFTTLKTTRAGESTIVASPYIVPQAAFFDPTTVTEIVRQANRFSLNDWAVWDERTFWLYGRGAGPSKRWRARVGPAQLSETGPQVDRLWESICVQFIDTSGTTRIVGPPGSGADFEDPVLRDSDPYNPATLAGKTRRDLLVMGTATPASATELGRRFLELSKELDTSGQASLIGHVLDDRGVMHPAWRVRAGDYISFVDAHDSGYRRVVRAGYEDGSKACSVDLDSPPEALAALLERLSASLVPIGLT